MSPPLEPEGGSVMRESRDVGAGVDDGAGVVGSMRVISNGVGGGVAGDVGGGRSLFSASAGERVGGSIT
jgi:hypothetical protein